MKSITEFSGKFLAAIVLMALAASVFAVGADAGAGRKKLTEDQKALHVLNRLGFGARPGDVERVRAMGVRKYIEQQLEPAAIGDAAAEEKTARLEVFKMTTAEVFAKYPNPGALLRNHHLQPTG